MKAIRRIFLSFFLAALFPTLLISSPTPNAEARPTYNVQFKLIKIMGSFGSGRGQFTDPTTIILDGKILYICDSGNNRIVKLDTDLNWLDSFSVLPEDLYKLDYPLGLIVDNSRILWVADTRNNRLVGFSDQGEFVRTFGEFGISAGTFNQPKGLGLDISGNIYVCDNGNDRVQVVDNKGTFIREFGQTGPLQERLQSPLQLSVMPDGMVAVSDTHSPPLKFFDSFGNFRQAFLTSSPNVITRPTGFSQDNYKNLYVADSASGKVVYFSLEKSTILGVITEGLREPYGIATVRDLVFVTDKKRHQLLVFRKQR